MYVNWQCSVRRQKCDKKEAEKILKYKDPTKEIQHMWNIKTKVIPVIIGTTGIISESLRKYLSNIPGKHKIKELQKTAIWGTAHLPPKVLM
jgi:dihydrodipicolinate reductase